MPETKLAKANIRRVEMALEGKATGKKGEDLPEILQSHTKEQIVNGKW